VEQGGLRYTLYCMESVGCSDNSKPLASVRKPMSTAQSRPESLLAMSLYRARNEEIKKYLDQLLEEYGEPKGTIQEVRAMMDRALSGEIHKIREDRF
jgi:hypothetical protein